MAETMQFDLVSPERLLASRKVREVQIPGAEGDMTAMPDHMPLITTLRPGIVTVAGPDGEESFMVTGGFAEINAGSVSVLAERAFPAKDVSRELLEGFIAQARAELEKAREAGAHNVVDDAQKLLSDMMALGDHMRV